MRLSCLLSLIFLLLPQAWAGPSQARKKHSSCERLCDELFAAVRANPDNLVMRLEEALIIQESCAAELVTAAIHAVNAEPALVEKIRKTALDLAPARQAAIAAAVRDYRAPVVASATPAAVEEIRRAVLPEPEAGKVRPGEEIRRAQLPDTLLTGQAMPAVNLANVPRAKPLK